jgi:hypothetical protein
MRSVHVRLHSVERNGCAGSVLVDVKGVDRRPNAELTSGVFRAGYNILNNEIHFTCDNVPSVMMYNRAVVSRLLHFGVDLKVMTRSAELHYSISVVEHLDLVSIVSVCNCLEKLFWCVKVIWTETVWQAFLNLFMVVDLRLCKKNVNTRMAKVTVV